MARKRTSWTARAAALPGAKLAPMPARQNPQLATLARRAPLSGRWSYEIKLDGYRFSARVEAGATRLFTREGHDWAKALSVQAKALAKLPVDSIWLDGETCCALMRPSTIHQGQTAGGTSTGLDRLWSLMCVFGNGRITAASGIPRWSAYGRINQQLKLFAKSHSTLRAPGHAPLKRTKLFAYMAARNQTRA